MNKETLHFAFCLNEQYVNYAAVCIRSIVLNNQNHSITIHILSDYLSEKAISNLKEAAESSNCNVEVHIIDDSILEELPQGRWPIHAWYRILLPEVVSTDVARVLYLDCDTLVMSDLADLFHLDLQDKPIAALPDPQSFSNEVFLRCKYPSHKKYFCSGIMLINLDYWRENNVKTKVISIANKYRDIIRFPDQDSLNILFQDSKILLPYRYGVMQWYFIKEIRKKIAKKELYTCLTDPKIIHFAGCAPWNKSLRPSLFSTEWDKINATLTSKAKVKYNCNWITLIKGYLYNMLHPIQTLKIRNHRLTYNNIMRHWDKY